MKVFSLVKRHLTSKILFKKNILKKLKFYFIFYFKLIIFISF
jgi:hypothetical protein